MRRERLEELIARHFDGTLDATEEAELAAALAASREARALLASYMRLEGAVAQPGVVRVRPGRAVRSRRAIASPGPVWPWALGAAAAAGFLLVIASGLSTPSGGPPAAKRPSVRPAPEEPPKAPEPPVEEPGAPRRVPPPSRPTPVAPAPAPSPKDPRPAPPEPPKGADPVPEKPKPPDPAPVPATEAVVARLLEGEGAPLDLRPGQGVGGRAAIQFPDKTRLDLGASSVLRGLADDGAGKRAHLDAGTLSADVARQAQGRPFVLTTPQAEIRVLGTKFTLSVTADATRLEVTEGRVRLTRLTDKRSVDVAAGQFAVASPAAPPRTQKLPIDEIVLYPSQAQLTGGEWRPIKDEKALDGLLLEADDTANKPIRRLPIDATKVNSWFAQSRSRSFVSFTFDADANKDYRVWVRGRCLAAADRLTSDSVMMEVANGRFVDRPADWHPYSDYLCSFDGYGNTEGFSWSGGFFDPGRTQKPIAVKFNATGKQLIRIHAMETPIQIDAIWISATQSNRPDPEQRPVRK